MWIALIDWLSNSRGNDTRDGENNIYLDRTVNATGFVLFHFGTFSSIVYNQVRHEFCELFKDGDYYCYCAYVLCISRYSDFLLSMLTNTGIFLRGLKLSGESRS